MKIAIAGLLVGTLGAMSSVCAADWKLVSDEKGFTDYIDIASIKKDGNIRTAWTLRNHKNTQTIAGNTQYLSAKELSGFDCKNDNHMRNYVVLHQDEMGHGPVVLSGPLSKTWQPVVPDSIGETMFKTVCGW